MASDQHYTYPGCTGPASFTDQEWEQAEQARRRAREEAANRCRHLVKDGKCLVPDLELPRVLSKAEQQELDRRRQAAAQQAAERAEEQPDLDTPEDDL